MASKTRKPKVRSFQFIGGKSKKFWEIVRDGTERMPVQEMPAAKRRKGTATR